LLGSDLRPDTVERVAKEMLSLEERHEQEVQRLREKHTTATQELTEALTGCKDELRSIRKTLATNSTGHTTLKHTALPAKAKAASEVSSHVSSRRV